MSAKHALSPAEAATICRCLDDQHIPVQVTVDDAETVHLWPQRQVTTAEEVTALAAVLSETDARVAWHEAVKL